MSRLSLYLIASTLFIGVVMGLTSMSLMSQHNAAVNQLSSNVAKRAAAVAALIKHTETQHRQELEYFAELSMVPKALDSGNYEVVAELLSKLMQSKSTVVQTRLFNPEGQEVFKLVNRAGVPVRLTNIELQDKSQRYYFKQLSSTAIGNSYLSPVDLNIDYGVIERPYRPVMRIAQKVRHLDSGQYLGSLMFNYDVKQELRQLASLLPEQLRFYIVDERQQFLAHPDSASLYCAELSCDDLFMESQVQRLAHQRVYFDDSLAAEINLDSPVQPVMMGAQLIVAYQHNYLPHLTQPISNFGVLTRSYQWWAALLVASLVCLVGCYSYQHLQNRIEERLQKAKMHKVLEGVTEMLERLHENDDAVTGSHVQRVADYSRLMAEHVGLDKQLVEDIHQFASLHDIGKISTPDAILGKPGKLDAQEWEVMKQHVDNGYQLLREFELSPVAENIVRGHHERWDGQGYPQRIAGEEIPIEARIVSLVDCFDALMSERPYKPAFSFEKSKEIINDLSGKAFDPYLVKMFNFLEADFRNSHPSPKTKSG
ncbi:HD domain-containing phosphohydrolase [Agarivorans aestuarii]|uniref:HD domain-containing phosphohydrolase n=1 Tax=Agarivorans aestuarii TaxID=1563703 RepID=UPI001C81B9C3|nr:HD domain-containing phosphohydrolase [Agarivorans aestuarii]